MEISYLCRSCLPEYKCEGEENGKGTECTDIFHNFRLFRNRNPDYKFLGFSQGKYLWNYLCWKACLNLLRFSPMFRFYRFWIISWFKKPIRNEQQRRVTGERYIVGITHRVVISRTMRPVLVTGMDNPKNIRKKSIKIPIYYSHKINEKPKKPQIPYTLRRSNLLIAQRYFIHKVYRNEKKNYIVIPDGDVAAFPLSCPIVFETDVEEGSNVSYTFDFGYKMRGKSVLGHRYSNKTNKGNWRPLRGPSHAIIDIFTFSRTQALRGKYRFHAKLDCKWGISRNHAWKTFHVFMK